MAPGQLPDPPAQLLLLDVCQRHRVPLGVAVLSCQPAGTTLIKPESILQDYNGSSHRKVRLTAQQAPTAVPGLRLEHCLIQFSICE
jgi:hypothetical protein